MSGTSSIREASPPQGDDRFSDHGAVVPLRILFVSRQFHPFLGGIETQTRLIAHTLARRHSVEVAATRFEAFTGKRFRQLSDSLLLPSFESFDDGPVRVIAMTPNRFDKARMAPIALRCLVRLGPRMNRELSRLGSSIFRRVYVPKLRRVIRDVDIVHSVSSGYFGQAAEQAARAEGVPFVLSTFVHPGQFGDDPDSVAFYNRADIVFSALESNRDKLVELGVRPEKLRISGVVPLLPETSDPEGFRLRVGIGEHPLVLYVGRLQRYKGPLTILQATRRVWHHMPEARFVFIGPPREPDVLDWFRDYSDPRIHYLGLVSEQTKADALAACDLFCMPSQFEVLPAAFLEAWSNGKAVIGGPAHGIRELVEGNGAGIVVDQQPDNVATAILQLLGDADLRDSLGRRGRDLVDSRYSIDALVEVFEETYLELTARRRSSPTEVNSQSG